MSDKTIALAPGNPLDIRPTELQDLADALRRELPDVDVTVIEGEPPTGYGVTAFEILNIFVSLPSVPHDVAVAAVTLITTKAVDWARRRLKKSPLRPKRVAIYGPNQEILKTVRVDPGGEAVDTTEDDLEERASFERYLEQQRAEEAKRQGR